LENIAAGRYFYVGHDFRGRSYDPPALQQAKAKVILDELDAQIAQIPDPETLPDTHMGEGSRVDAQAKIILLQIKAETRFDESITKTLDVPPHPRPHHPRPSSLRNVQGSNHLTLRSRLSQDYVSILTRGSAPRQSRNGSWRLSVMQPDSGRREIKNKGKS
jgi:hypothetical protein